MWLWLLLLLWIPVLPVLLDVLIVLEAAAGFPLVDKPAEATPRPRAPPPPRARTHIPHAHTRATQTLVLFDAHAMRAHAACCTQPESRSSIRRLQSSGSTRLAAFLSSYAALRPLKAACLEALPQLALQGYFLASCVSPGSLGVPAHLECGRNTTAVLAVSLAISGASVVLQSSYHWACFALRVRHTGTCCRVKCVCTGALSECHAPRGLELTPVAPPPQAELRSMTHLDEESCCSGWCAYLHLLTAAAGGLPLEDLRHNRIDTLQLHLPLSSGKQAGAVAVSGSPRCNLLSTLLC